VNDNKLHNDANQPIPEKYRLERIKKYISENLAANLKVSVVAPHFNLSVSTLQHMFQIHEGQSYHRFVEQKRMEKAFELITKEGQIIKEVMPQTGYHKRTTFNRAFKRFYKLSPRHFMK
jgi:two-component system, response regulator YesN